MASRAQDQYKAAQTTKLRLPRSYRSASSALPQARQILGTSRSTGQHQRRSEPRLHTLRGQQADEPGQVRPSVDTWPPPVKYRLRQDPSLFTNDTRIRGNLQRPYLQLADYVRGMDATDAELIKHRAMQTLKDMEDLGNEISTIQENVIGCLVSADDCSGHEVKFSTDALKEILCEIARLGAIPERMKSILPIEEYIGSVLGKDDGQAYEEEWDIVDSKEAREAK